MKVPSGRSVLRVTAQLPGRQTTYDIQPEVKEQVQCNLQVRFSFGKRAPINHSLLFQDFGTIGDTEAAEHLFNGDYEFPPSSDKATISLLREAACLRIELNALPQDTSYITISEYLDFWSTAKEATSLSKRGHHFGNYKAICSHPDLVSYM